MDPLGKNTYFLKRYDPSDSFGTFISESVSDLYICYGLSFSVTFYFRNVKLATLQIFFTLVYLNA